jgi:nucleotide-binding universal stress UspA family protein
VDDRVGATLYKVIVVGTDGSERAAVAVTHALELARMFGARLHVVQVVHPALKAGFSDSSGGQLEVDKLRDQAEHRTAQVSAQLLAEAERQGVPVVMHNPAGEEVADTLVKTAETVGADLIVVGNRGMTGVSRFVLGSVPNKVSHHCSCNLLIVNTDTN